MSTLLILKMVPSNVGSLLGSVSQVNRHLVMSKCDLLLAIIFN